MFMVCFGPMAATIRDLIEDGACVEVYCAQCRMMTLVSATGSLGKWGAERLVRDAKRRLRCHKCGMRGAIRVTFPEPVIEAEKRARRLPIHD